MSNTRLSSKPVFSRSLPARAREAGAAAAQSAAQSAQAAAQSAAQTAAVGVTSAAQTAAHEMGRSMRQGVHAARSWTAPRLESAADYTTATVAPRVAGTLRSTARQISPEDARRRGPRPALVMSLLAFAAAAAAAAVAALVRRQYKAAMEADTESDAIDIDDAREPDATASGEPAEPGQPSTTGGTRVNGRTSSSGW